MIKNPEIHTNGVPAVPTRLAMNRLGPQSRSATVPASLKNLSEANGRDDDPGQSRLTAKKLAEDKARARTVARAGGCREAVCRDRRSSQRDHRGQRRG